VFEKSSASCEAKSSCSAGYSAPIQFRSFWEVWGFGAYIAFPFTSNLRFALSEAGKEAGGGAEGKVLDVESPLLRVIWGRVREVRDSLSVGAVMVLVCLGCYGLSWIGWLLRLQLYGV